MGSLNAFLISQCYLASGFPKKKTSHYKKMKKHSKKKKSVKQPTVSLKPSLSSGPSLEPSQRLTASNEPSQLPSISMLPTKTTFRCGSSFNFQADYRGTISETASGRTCQRWDSDEPHSHDMKPLSLEYGLEENYCRNPDNGDAA